MKRPKAVPRWREGGREFDFRDPLGHIAELNLSLLATVVVLCAVARSSVAVDIGQSTGPVLIALAATVLALSVTDRLILETDKRRVRVSKGPEKE